LVVIHDLVNIALSFIMIKYVKSSYDRIDSGIKFFNLIQALSQIQQMNILDINYMEETSGDTHV